MRADGYLLSRRATLAAMSGVLLGMLLSRAHATVAMIVTGLGLGLLIQNLSLAVQNGVPSRHLGAATSAAQFFRTIGGTIGFAVMAVTLAIVLAIPELPLRRTVREVPA